MCNPFGVDPQVWQSAIAQTYTAMVDVARNQQTISYTDLVAQIPAIADLQPRDPRLDGLLGQICEHEDAAGRGMLSVVVVHQEGDRMPGDEFFSLAQRLGRQVQDRDALFSEELRQVHGNWSPTQGLEQIQCLVCSSPSFCHVRPLANTQDITYAVCSGADRHIHIRYFDQEANTDQIVELVQFLAAQHHRR